jgi:phage gpG-like protein
MAGTVDWHPETANRKIRSWAVRSLEAAAIVVENKAKELVSVAGTGMAVKGGGIVPHTGGRGKHIHGAFPSSPGEPPRKQTGHLRRSITHEVDRSNLVARIGTNVVYGRYLELGCRNLLPRPWLRRAFAESAPVVRRILSRPA